MEIDRRTNELLDALDGATLLTPFTDRDPTFTIEDANALRAHVTRRRAARGERPIGRKLGFTNTTIWESYGLTAPIWAPVYDSTVTLLTQPEGTVSIERLCQPRLEPEIVLYFHSSPPLITDETGLLAHIGWIALGFEIVQSHFPAWRFRTADAIAAFGVHGHLIVGPPRPVAALADPVTALRAFTITLAADAVPREQGGGAQVLGSPLVATIQMLGELDGQPDAAPIAAGEIITTGTLTPAVPIAPGQTWSTAVAGIDLENIYLHIAMGNGT